MDVASLVRRVVGLGHRLLACEGVDGFPVIVPVGIAGSDRAGLHLDASPGVLPSGGRRAGFLAHAFGPQCVGLGMRTLTRWLAVGDEGAVYAPHMSKGMSAPANRTVQMIANGLVAKTGMRCSRRDGSLERLRSLARQG